jgi:hypothetical protein
VVGIEDITIFVLGSIQGTEYFPFLRLTINGHLGFILVALMAFLLALGLNLSAVLVGGGAMLLAGMQLYDDQDNATEKL